MTSERFEFASPPKRVTHSGAWFLNSLMASSVLEFTAFLAMCGFFLLFRAPAMMLSVVLGQARFIVVVVVRVDKDAENCFLIPPRLMIVNLSNASEVFIFRWLVIATNVIFYSHYQTNAESSPCVDIVTAAIRPQAKLQRMQSFH